eukprot:3701714-Alexandrium_andersonii.AAC.1
MSTLGSSCAALRLQWARGSGLSAAAMWTGSRNVAVPALVVVAWSRRYAVVEYIEAHHGQELRELIGAGSAAGRRGDAVQAALAARCAVSRQEARLWCAAFGEAWSSEE